MPFCLSWLSNTPSSVGWVVMCVLSLWLSVPWDPSPKQTGGMTQEVCISHSISAISHPTTSCAKRLQTPLTHSDDLRVISDMGFGDHCVPSNAVPIKQPLLKKGKDGIQCEMGSPYSSHLENCFHCCDKPHDQQQAGKKRVLSSSHFLITVHH